MTDDKGTPDERWRRWRLAFGNEDEDPAGFGLSARDVRLDQALKMLYGGGSGQGATSKSRRGGLGGSAPRVARWLGDIREFFPAPVVQVIQRDAFDRLGLKQMLLEPEFLAAMEADVHLVADLISLGSAMPKKSKETARQVVEKVVQELMKRLEQKTTETLRGALNRSQRTFRPRFSDIDWPTTIRANLRHYQPDYRTVVPEKLIGFGRKSKRLSDLEEIILCVDQSGSMASSVVYSSIFAAVMGSMPALDTKLVVFDTAVIDLTEQLADPVEVLFGVQLGGGTDINQALAYCETLVRQPTKAHLVLITDLFEGGNAAEMVERAAGLIASGVNVITLLALSDDGKPSYDEELSQKLAALDSPVFACTPDLFPDLMAAALKREDLQAWAAARDIALVRGGEA
ncbi:MAG: VWA domain-containing protein [Kiloniellales bacterium]|nr:VWA domain-containing protein [Kiloniellales bacterium]